MRLFDGLEGTDYQDVLRAVGRMLDTQGYRQCRLVELDEVLVVRARRIGSPTDNCESLQFTDEQVRELMRESFRQRGTGPLPAIPRRSRLAVLQQQGVEGTAPLSAWLAQAEQNGYQDTLRAIGWFLDDGHFRGFRIVEQDDGILVRARRADGDGFETYMLTGQDLRALLWDSFLVHDTAPLRQRARRDRATAA